MHSNFFFATITNKTNKYFKDKCDLPRENDNTNDERYIVWTIYRSFSAIYRSFILNGKAIISLKNYRSFFLNGIMVLSNNSIITIWWKVRKPGVGYQFADHLFYNFNVLFLLKKKVLVLYFYNVSFRCL